MVEPDCVVIGGGLAGLSAARRLHKKGIKALVIDSAPIKNKTAPGGFARFSGAKFSLPPAGLGLKEPLGGIEALQSYIRQALKLAGLADRCTDSSLEKLTDTSIGSIPLRRYESIVLSPQEVHELVEVLAKPLIESGNFLRGKVLSLDASKTDVQVEVDCDGNVSQVSAKVLIVAGGRQLTEILALAGAKSFSTKGLDVGFRAESPPGVLFERLKQLGPDAKLIKDSCRTFCLNSPGEVYWYPWNSLMIPGGVVAEANANRANVGILYRCQKREPMLRRLSHYSEKIFGESGRKTLVFGSQYMDDLKKDLCILYGTETGGSIIEFLSMLFGRDLFPTNILMSAHLPLIDWHWDTFCKPNSFHTSLPQIYAAGDIAGHARGLLQAIVSGLGAADQVKKEHYS